MPGRTASWRTTRPSRWSCCRPTGSRSWARATRSSSGPSGAGSLADSFRLSGSSILTLGFASSPVPGASLAAFTEAALGLILVALLISYLPTIYGAFSRRELLVNLLEVRADSPPSAVVLLTRAHRLRGLDALHEMWERWEPWFSELEETHTSLPILVFYRSQQADHSWVNAAEAIMDTAALARSVVDIPLDVQADLTIRAGYLAMRRIADYFFLRYDAHPPQDAPTSISRELFERVCDVLAADGVPVEGRPGPGLPGLQRLARQLRRAGAGAGARHDRAALVVDPADGLGLRHRRARPRPTGPGRLTRRGVRRGAARLRRWPG